MLPGKYEPGSVIEARLRIFVNGVERPHVKADYAIDSSAGLPDTFIMTGSGISSRTGSITWAPDTAVERNPFKPIGETRWVPRRGDRVVIESEVAGVSFRAFTGYLRGTTFGLQDGSAVSDITDGLGDFLAQKVTIGHFGGSVGGIIPAWQAYRALTACGLGVLPPADKNTVIQAVQQLYTGQAEIGNHSGRFMQGDRYGVHTMSLSYTPSSTRVTGDVFVVTRCATSFDTSVRVKVGGAWFQLTFSRARQEYRLTKNGATLAVEKRDASDIDPLPLMAFTIGTDNIRLWTSRTTSVSVPVVNSRNSFTDLETINTPGVSVRYLNYYPAQQRVIDQLHHSPAAYNLPVNREAQQQQKGVRGYEAVAAKTILDEFCEATLSALAMDEYGVPRLYAREVGIVRPPNPDVIRVSEKVFSGSYTAGLETSYSAVEVTFKESYVTAQGKTGTKGTVFYQPANRQEIQVGEPLQEIISPDEDKDVINPDLDWDAVIDMGDGVDNRRAFNQIDGSYWGICFEDPNRDGEMRWTGAGAENISATIEQIGLRAFKMVHSVTNGSPDWKYYLTSPTLGSSEIRSGNRGVPLPIIRCECIINWVDNAVNTTGRGRTGTQALTFSHDAGWWLTRPEAVFLANQLAGEVSQERVTFTALPVLWDPRIQLFDTLRIIGQQTTDYEVVDAWEAQAMVTGVSVEWEGNVPSLSLGLTTVLLKDLLGGKTYADLLSAYPTYKDIPATASYDAVYQQLPERAT